MINRSLANKNKLSPNNFKKLRSCRKFNGYGTLSLSLSHNSIVDRFKKRRIETSYSKVTSRGFTIVELLVVIVVIGILAAITIVSYTGITTRANLVSAQSDLTNDTNQLKSYYTIYGAYPVLDGNNCPTAPSTVDNAYCLKVSPGNTLNYSIDHNLDGTTNNNNFGLSIKSNNASTYFTNNASVSCPPNFIPVPGSATYGTSDFCAMKYDASQVGSSTTPISQPALPWVNISQTTAIANAPNTKNQDGTTCTSCHLLTEPEYMTIAQNVLSVASNWDNGAGVHAVGTGYIYSGHNDNAPANAIAPVADDTDGYNGTGNTAPSNQKRTLTLTNGQVIWDLSGNVYEWTNATIGANLQPGLSGEVAYAWKQWNNGSLLMNGLPYNSQPASTGIAGITWNSSAGVGQLYSDYGETGARAFLRGGPWNGNSYAGVLGLALFGSAGSTGTYIGFRVSR
jgi:prepilin-type N-terminal cleavage/methylation domain-containing protein